ncbi:MAG: biotin--[acetyl-CoA-carboxylase] ligase [Bacteroidales bacterium]|nr:biotin--[acetyl-CoA-carboxylase] ligase [Bacteroidales bacterium]
MRIVRFDTLPSTNQYCELLNLTETEEFTVIVACTQTAGIGQRGNHWEASPNQNLTFSIILKPIFLPIADQYQLTKAVSLGITDWLMPIVPQGKERVRIKWPNDIYVESSKICGILTTHRIVGERISSTIVGIGVNVNQQQFPDWVPNPTSLRIVTGKEWHLDGLLDSLLSSISKRYEELRTQPLGILDSPYLNLLLRRGIEAPYSYHGNTIAATLQGVNRYGHLQLTTRTGEHLSCQLKEIQFL